MEPRRPNTKPTNLEETIPLKEGDRYLVNDIVYLDDRPYQVKFISNNQAVVRWMSDDEFRRATESD